jgi:putative sigma-54 modulation protein
MTLNVSFKHMDSSNTLRAYAEEKSERLKKYFKGKITITWNFVIENQTRVAHCHLLGNHMNYFAESANGDFYASVDEAIERIERQLRKHKEIVKDHLHKHGRRSANVA